MPFHFSLDRSSEAGQPLSVRLSGQMTLGPRLLEFSRMAIAALASRKANALLLEMSEVDAIDSAALGELIIIYTAAGQQSCRICLVSPSAQIVRLLDTTRLRAMLPDFRDAELASAWLAN
jgi:anti-anti-sigma factor